MVCHIQDHWSGVGVNFPEDERLRSFGFKVAMRPRFGEPTWRLGRVTYSHQAALRYCRDMETMGHELSRRGNDGSNP